MTSGPSLFLLRSLGSRALPLWIFLTSEPRLHAIGSYYVIVASLGKRELPLCLSLVFEGKYLRAVSVPFSLPPLRYQTRR